MIELESIKKDLSFFPPPYKFKELEETLKACTSLDLFNRFRLTLEKDLTELNRVVTQLAKEEDVARNLGNTKMQLLSQLE